MISGRSGAFTMEAAIGMPILLLLMIIGLYAGLIIYQHAVLFSLAQEMAERAAYIWDNSYKEPVSGFVEQGRDDGLYWRLTSDGSLPFLTGGIGSPIIHLIPSQEDEEPGSLPMRKLRRTAVVPSGIRGEIRYENRIAEKVITVELVKPLRLPLWLQQLFTSERRVTAVYTISDPAEYLRGINLIRTYTGIGRAAMSPEEARSLFAEPAADGKTAKVASHEEAARWLRLHTGGVEKRYATSHGDRLIDSYVSGTAHQAFYTYRESQILLQADKDVELLKEGVLERVVWHFFLGTDNRNPPPSQHLLEQLAARGIQAEIHPGGDPYTQ